MKKSISSVAPLLLLVGIAPFIGCCGCSASPGYRNRSVVYEQVVLPDEISDQLAIRLWRFGDKGHENLYKVDISFEDRHYRLDLSGFITAARGDTIIFEDKRVNRVTLGSSNLGPGPAFGQTTKDWIKIVNDTP